MEEWEEWDEWVLERRSSTEGREEERLGRDPAQCAKKKPSGDTAVCGESVEKTRTQTRARKFFGT